jgi:hypothetical protein
LYKNTCSELGEDATGEGAVLQSTESAPGAGSASMTTSANDPSPDASLEAQLALAQPGMIQGATVPAGSFVDVPADFEGSSRAVLLVLSPTTETGLTASFGGTELQPLDFLGSPVLGADLAPPLNGMVRLTNSTSSPIEAAVLVAPESLRAMSVVVTPSLASVGEPVTVTASLTVSDAGDSPRAQVTDADGAVVADLALSPTGTAGTYSATFTPPHADTYSVASAVDGLRPRRATDVFTVSAGGARLTGNFNETLSDANGNGLADVLLVRPDLSVVRPGSYRVSARLVDASGVVVGVAGTRAELASGDQVVDLRFEGKDIFATGRSGPYRVSTSRSARTTLAWNLNRRSPSWGKRAPTTTTSSSTSRSRSTGMGSPMKPWIETETVKSTTSTWRGRSASTMAAPTRSMPC